MSGQSVYHEFHRGRVVVEYFNTVFEPFGPIPLELGEICLRMESYRCIRPGERLLPKGLRAQSPEQEAIRTKVGPRLFPRYQVEQNQCAVDVREAKRHIRTERGRWCAEDRERNDCADEECELHQNTRRTYEEGRAIGCWCLEAAKATHTGNAD